MDLCWVRYKNHSSSRYILLVSLGTYEGKLCCLDTDLMHNDDKEFIRVWADVLDKVSLQERVAVIKKNRPDLMRCYRTISLSNLYISKQYKINSTTPTSP